MIKYIYVQKRFGNIRFSLYKLGKKLTIRLEYSIGWEDKKEVNK